jgi:protein phosphatase
VVACIPDDPDVLAGKGALFAVADGLGGHAAGEVASRAALDALVGEYYSPRAPHRVEAAMQQAVQAANLRVYALAHGADPTLHGMQTTLAAVVLAGRHAYVAHAGDSRVYLLRNGEFTQLTADHSEAAELLRLRLITPEQAREHPRRNVLTRTLGHHRLLRPDFARLAVLAGDAFLLCTDGLWGEVEPADLRRATQMAPAAACRELVRLACERGGSDNITVQVVRVIEAGAEPQAPRAGRIARLLAGLRGG